MKIKNEIAQVVRRFWRAVISRLPRFAQCFLGYHPVVTVGFESTGGIDFMCGDGSQRVERCKFCKKALTFD